MLTVAVAMPSLFGANAICILHPWSTGTPRSQLADILNKDEPGPEMEILVRVIEEAPVFFTVMNRGTLWVLGRTCPKSIDDEDN